MCWCLHLRALSIRHRLLGQGMSLAMALGEHEQTKMLNQQRLRATFVRLCIS
jgi:hypothetical protein